MDWLEAVRDTFWGWHTLLLILAAGLWFTFSTRAYQLRGTGRWLRAAAPGGTFRALTAALGGSIGTGNIVGVGVAITTGGPGALLWMWVSAFFGMMTVFAENFLAARYPQAPGPLGYLRAAGRWGGALAAVYAGGCAASALGMGAMVQTKACAQALEELGLPPVLTGALLAVLIFFVARGGLQVAGRITERLVPAMTLLFFAGAFATLWVFRERLPGVLLSVVRGAFSFRATAGGRAGAFLALKVGVSRGVFTNEAGLGSSSFAYDGVRDRDPVELGCLGIFQVFLDTLVMCTVTGLCILCCRSPVLEGGRLVSFAFQAALGPAGGWLVSLCTALFAVATVIAWCCYGRESFLYLCPGRRRLNLYCAVSAAAAFLGCLLPLDLVFLLSDTANGLMALPNLAGLAFHRREVAAALQFPSKRDRIKHPRGSSRSL